MTNNISLKRTSKGNFAIILGEEHGELAMSIFFAAVKGIAGDANRLIEEPKGSNARTLSEVVSKVEGVGNPIKMSLNPTALAPKVLQGVDRLPDEKQANEIIAFLAERIPAYHHSKLRTFYAELERFTGVGLYEEHKKRFKRMTTGDVGKFPNRKIDTAIEMIGARAVYEFARRYVR